MSEDIEKNETEAHIHRVVEEVEEERLRQIMEEGWTPDHDDHHDIGELALAAASYAASGARQTGDDTVKMATALWPFESIFRPSNFPRRDLIRAAALMIAEIERRDRAMLDSGKALDESDG